VIGGDGDSGVSHETKQACALLRRFTRPTDAGCWFAVGAVGATRDQRSKVRSVVTNS
jgi:hypothetical protein